MSGSRWQRAAQRRKLFNQGVHLVAEGLPDEAERAYRRYLELAPWSAAAWFNLGLIYKRWRRWADVLSCNQQVVQLSPDDVGAWWNLGIAATALRDWTTARTAWTRVGVAIPHGDGPIELDLGRTPVRLNPDGNAEVVWCRRIDPARAIIENVPLPGSGHRWHDCVLHDGDPRGERTVEGRKYPVFNEIELWQPSEIPTSQVHVVAPTGEDARALVAIFEEAALAAEDWTATVRHLCQTCSDGSPSEARFSGDDWVIERHFGLAGFPGDVEHLLESWARAFRGRGYSQVVPVD